MNISVVLNKCPKPLRRWLIKARRTNPESLGRRRFDRQKDGKMKVGIVGSGFVGATAGYRLVMQGVGRKVVLVDKNVARAEAEADEIRHAVPFAHPLFWPRFHEPNIRP
jgi:hypothetical protein